MNFPTSCRLWRWPVESPKSVLRTDFAGVRPIFRPVPLRAHADGWSEERQCGFFAALYATGTVMAAAHAVGMARASAYWRREQPGAESFAHAWKHVLTAPGSGKIGTWRPDFRSLTLPMFYSLTWTGCVQPVIYRGKMVAIRRRHADSRFSACCGGLARGPTPTGRMPSHDPGKVSQNPPVCGSYPDRISPKRGGQSVSAPCARP